MEINRRIFLKTGSATSAALILGFCIGKDTVLGETQVAFAPNAWLTITADGTVTIVAAKSEMGQGVLTSLPMIVAEELDVDWKSVKVERPVLDPKYGNQGTGGSTSIRRGWGPLRTAGANARAMLISAAAQKWNVSPESCITANGRVQHEASKRSESYGNLVELASQVPVPAKVQLKDPREFRLVGQPIRRIDAEEKVNGTAQFGIDVRIPGMVYASIAQPPVFGGKVANFDTHRAKRMTGVRDVVEVSGAVAVVADTFWQALEGRRALAIIWDEGPHANLNDAEILRTLRAGFNKTPVVVTKRGNAEATIAAAPLARKIEVEYYTPFLAHAPMEPMNCTAHLHNGKCAVWAPTQWPSSIRDDGAKALGISPEDITVNITLLGGGFGRRGYDDFALQAMMLSKATNMPVKLMWSREDDIEHDYYRPPSLHRISATLDEKALPSAWIHHVVSSAIDGEPGSYFVDSAADLPYAIPNINVKYSAVDIPIPFGWWRGVFSVQNGFAQECFLDELALLARRDPLELRLELLRDSPRHKATLELAAEKAGWGRNSSEGRFLGVAIVKSFDSYVAQAAEISLDDDGSVRVHRVVCAIDCGIAINPRTIEAQMQGGIVFGLSAALYGEITIDHGRVQQTNFDSYPLLRIDRMPRVEVHIVSSTEHPGGVGEAGVPPIAAAVANALFAATKRPIRSLPIRP